MGSGFLLPKLGGPGVFFATILNLGISIYSGANGNQIAWETRRFTTYEQLQRSMRRWNIVALIGVGIALALLLYLR
jgi:hypothetical protein